MRRAQSTTPGAEQAGGLVEKTNGVEVILARVKAKEHEGSERGEKDANSAC
jgi:hypothetical protein